MLIGISGWKGSGKDAAASVLVNEFKFKQFSFASILKDMTAETYGIDRKAMDDRDLKEAPLLNFPVDARDSFSNEIKRILEKEFKAAPNGKLYWTPRAVLILEGSIKRSVDPAFWTKKALSQISNNDLAVISDLRYKSEAKEIRDRADALGVKSLLIRVNRFETSNSLDASERDMDDYTGFDSVINNTGTLEEFQQTVSQIVFENL